MDQDLLKLQKNNSLKKLKKHFVLGLNVKVHLVKKVDGLIVIHQLEKMVK